MQDQMNEVLTLKDIENIPSGSFAVIGCPVGHSLSPLLHRALSDREDYYKLLITPEELESAVPRLIARLRGFNCTIPHKRAIMEHLDALDESAYGYGAVNTVKIGADGAKGYNTDGAGLLAALDRAKLKLEGDVLLIGSGGAARVLALEAIRAGARLTILCRNKLKGSALRSELLTRFKEAEIYINPNEYADSYSLIMNATPVGMYPKTEDMPIALGLLERAGGVFDAIYNPLKTRLIKEAEKRGKHSENGIFMLVGQAAEARRIWTGETFRSEQLERAARALYEALEEEGYDNRSEE